MKGNFLSKVWKVKGTYLYVSNVYKVKETYC